MQLIFNGLQLSGFNLNDWLANVSAEKMTDTTAFVAEMFKTGVFQALVSERVSLSEIVKGLRSYIGNMSAGKLLIEM